MEKRETSQRAWGTKEKAAHEAWQDLIWATMAAYEARERWEKEGTVAAHEAWGDAIRVAELKLHEVCGCIEDGLHGVDFNRP